MTSKLTSKFPARAGLLRHSAAWFLGALVFMFVTAPFIEELPNGKLVEAAWGSIYVLVARMSPGAFSGVAASSQPLHGFDALYFSLITLTTAGYGDIAPVSGPARMLAMLEAVTGTMYMAALVARLVSGYSSAATTKSETNTAP